MWSGESRFTMFQSDWSIRVRGDWSTHHALGLLYKPVFLSGAVIWGCCNWLALRSATLCVESIRSADQDIPNLDLFSPQMVWTFSKMIMPGFTHLFMSGSGSKRHYFHTWIGHHTWTPHLSYIGNLCDLESLGWEDIFNNQYNSGQQ